MLWYGCAMKAPLHFHAAMRRLKVVFVHGDGQAEEKIVSRLAREGMRISSAADNRDGLRLLYDVRPDVILLELIPNSEETWEALGQFRMFTQAPAFILGPAPSEADRVRGLKLRVTEFINADQIDPLIAKLDEIQKAAGIRPAKARVAGFR